MCLIYVSKHPKLNFVPAKCDIFGFNCFDVCFNTFSIHKLKVEKDYYFKTIFLSSMSQHVISDPIQLYSIFLF